MAEHDVTVFNVSADEPGGTDATVQLTGAAVQCIASAVSAASQSNNISVTLTGAEVSAEAGNVVGFGQGTPGTLGYPRVGMSLIGGEQPWATNHPDAAYQLEGIAKMDFLMLNSFTTKIPAIVDNATFRSIQNIIIDLKSRNPDLQIFLYVNCQETRNSGSAGANKLYNEDGPAGAELFWDTQSAGKYGSNLLDSGGTDLTPIGPYASTGLPVNDWWARDGSGFKRSTFGSPPDLPYSINIGPGKAQPDANGQLYPQWYFDNVVVPDILSPHFISNGGVGFGLTGVNIFCDVTDDTPRTNTIDYNGDGRSDQARSVWDAFDGDHVNNLETANYGGGVYSAAAYRAGHRLFHNTIKAYDPDIQVSHNGVTWSRQNESTAASVPVDVQPEFQLVEGTSIPLVSNTPRQAMTVGLFSEGMTKQAGFPVTGVGADGLLNGLPFPGTTRGWWIAYNQYRFTSEIADGGNYSGTSGSTWCKTVMTPATINGERQYDWVPDPDSVFHLMRWLLCMALLDNGYFVHSGIQVGTIRTGSSQGAVVFDEFGTINTSVSGLTKGWLGQPLEGKVHIPFVGSTTHGLMKREYENGLVITTTSKTNTIQVNIADIGGAGVWKRITGFQDTAWNDGSTVNSSFNMPPIDGIILQRL